MKQEYNKGTFVRVESPRNGVVIGVVKSSEVNLVTGLTEYNVDYERDGEIWTMIGVPAYAVSNSPVTPCYEVHTLSSEGQTWSKEREFLFESQARKFIDDRKFPADKLKHVYNGVLICEEMYKYGIKQSTHIKFD